MIRHASPRGGFLFSLFSPRPPLRMGSAPFSLLSRVILAPIFSRAFSWPATLFRLQPCRLPFHLNAGGTSATTDQRLIVAVAGSACHAVVRQLDEGRLPRPHTNHVHILLQLVLRPLLSPVRPGGSVLWRICSSQPARSLSEFGRPSLTLIPGLDYERAPAKPEPDVAASPDGSRTRSQRRALTDPGLDAAASPGGTTALRFVRDYLWRRFAHFKLGAYFLDLRGLLFELRRENSHCRL
jgi:hypothetical protein